MKFQGKRNNLIQPSETQFLTFRHNQPQVFQSTGRSAASQKIQYKSLQKYPIDLNLAKKKTTQQQFLNDYNDYNNAEVVQFVNPNAYKKKLNAVKSQEKIIIQQRIQPDMPFSHAINCQSPFPNLQESSIQINAQTKNDVLKKKIDRLIRNLKKQQRKQLSLQKQIQTLNHEIEDTQKQYIDQQQSISQLEEIFIQNTKQCQKILKNVKSIKNKNQYLKQQLIAIEQESEYQSFQNSRQQNHKNISLIKNLHNEITRIQSLRQQIISKSQRLERQIKNMQQLLGKSHQIDFYIRQAVSRQSKQTSKNSSKQRLFHQFSSANSLQFDK